MLQSNTGSYRVGERNILLVKEMLTDEGIPILAEDTSGPKGRNLRFDLYCGVVRIK